jgi:hypothetical protein
MAGGNALSMKTQLLVGTVLSFCAAHAVGAFYIEPRVSFLGLSESPKINDVGREISHDKPSVVPGIDFGYELSSRLNLELRFTSLREITVNKLSNSSQILPGDGAFLTVLTTYDLSYESHLFTAALPIKLIDDKLSVSITPLLILERAEYVLHRPPQPYESALPGYNGRIYARKDSNVGGGAELSASYKLNDHVSASVHYSYSVLDSFEAHLFGAGFVFRF